MIKKKSSLTGSGGLDPKENESAKSATGLELTDVKSHKSLALFGSESDPKPLSKSTKEDVQQEKFQIKGSVVTKGKKREKKVIVMKDVVTTIKTYEIEFDSSGNKEVQETERTETQTETFSSCDPAHSSTVKQSITLPSSKVIDAPVVATEKQDVVTKQKTKVKEGSNPSIVTVLKDKKISSTITTGKSKYHDHGPDPKPLPPVSNTNHPPGPVHKHSGKATSTTTTTTTVSPAAASAGKKVRKRTTSEQKRYHEAHHVKVHRHHHEGHYDNDSSDTSPTV